MMARILLLMLLVLITGCKSYPRYRTGGEVLPPEIDQSEVKHTTNDYLRLGTILQSYLGKPYSGRSKWEDGVDCSHFTRSVFRRFNKFELPRTVAEQFKAGRSVHYNRLAYGDLIFFKTERNRVSHVGVFVGDGQFIHASTSRGVIISYLNEKYWAQRWSGARRILD